ncbi:gliding motility lipoprotein GldD [Flavobacterium sp. SE-s28]|uniref:Gliding motility lipoprotein GldD n=1 Tax=Flavobacterium silvaticum TaxID=1852020 RepID=A0A972FJC9_9FLAO|nr:gliding motility lipoprotein GldD [Flavobacterium silvaticum]NMH27031.1 gliding motility lipoprotein GldD [Flavobacterium silvaticum]
MLKKSVGFGFATVIALSVSGCGNGDVLPKPSSYLRLDYPVARYVDFESDCPYGFFMNSSAKIEVSKNCGFAIHYPKMKATVYLSYMPVNGNIEALLNDAQTLTYKHVIKADNITEQPYLNPDKKTYGMFYSVGGNAATNSQFYLTDSTKHFVRGSLYFYAKPNFDSIMPAADYIKNDMQTLMETIHWK